ncbi:MAG: shikimate kinase [Clostridia bacterium]|nr:shikimate kinase [Clostridia bacterium]
MDNIILIGMPGSGKSSVGVVLAKALGYDFLDGDLLIQSREGALLQELLDSRGTEAFLDLEGEVLSSIRCQRTVIAPGGSCVCRAKAMEHLRSLGTVVYLRLSYDEMAGRIHNLATRGIALAPGQTLKQVYDWRVPLYEAYAHITVDADGQTLYDTLEAVRMALVQKKAL